MRTSCPEEELGEEDLKHEREPEDRHRETEEARHRRRVIEDGVLPYSGVHADQYPDQEREQLGHDHELKGVRDDARQVVPDRRLNEERGPELVRHSVLQPVDVADGDRIFEVLALGDVLERLLRDQRIELQRRQRVPDRRDADEDQEARREKDGNRVEDPAKNESEHGSSSLRSLRKTGVPPPVGGGTPISDELY